MQSRTGLSLLGGLLFLTGSAEVSGGEIRHLGGRLQLFLDDWLVDSSDNIRWVLHSPERREAAIRVDRPWEDIYMYNPVVIKDGHRYRMWYRAKYVERPFLTAYAESLDGIHWVKPSLGLIEFDGSRDNNIIWPIPGADGRSFSVFKDENPDARADARYKAITNLNEVTASGKRRAVIYGLASPDGLRWRHLQKEPMVKALVEDPQFDSHNIVLWDSVRRHYAIYARGWYRKGLPPPGSERVGRTADTVTMKLPSGETRELVHIRDIRRYVSKDFANWSAQEYIGLGEAPLEHLYKNSATPYYRDPGLIFMFPKRFLPTRKADPGLGTRRSFRHRIHVQPGWPQLRPPLHGSLPPAGPEPRWPGTNVRSTWAPAWSPPENGRCPSTSSSTARPLRWSFGGECRGWTAWLRCGRPMREGRS